MAVFVGRATERALLSAWIREEQGYAPGNLVNLLSLLHGDLKGVGLSGLAIRHAYLQDIEAQGANLAGAHLSDTVFGAGSVTPPRRWPSALSDGI